MNKVIEDEDYSTLRNINRRKGKSLRRQTGH